jgi:aldehyde:ferredoxin oxidoreductase
MFGYHGQYLHCDLSSGNFSLIPLEESVLRDYIGGSGLGTYLLFRHQAAQLSPLDELAPLIFALSPLVGSPLTTSAKFAVVCKSPLTERINDSLASSAFAIAAKKSGVDAIVITGRAPQPSLLKVENLTASLVPAEETWGMQISQTSQSLRDRFGSRYKSAVIGPAGENLVRYATISHDGRHAGRGGSGAVMGSKNLKALLVAGDQLPEFAHPRELIDLARDVSKRSFGPATAKYRELGTASNLLVFNRLQCLPTRNFQQNEFEHAAEISPEMLNTTREKTRESCAACTIGCEHLYAIRGDDSANPQKVRLEYENLFALGPLCGIADPDAILRASQLCDELGLDTISTGGTIAFAMECQQRGWIDEPDLQFGNADGLLSAIRLVASRSGFGDLLAEGSLRLARAIGRDSIRFAPQVKGLEIPGYDPRSLQTMALGFAVGTRGADHNRSGAYEADFSSDADRLQVTTASATQAIATEDRAAIMDSLILCKFLRGVFSDFYAETAEMLALITGWSVDAAELRMTAKRIVAARKKFNIDCGWTPPEDTLPERFFSDAAVRSIQSPSTGTEVARCETGPLISRSAMQQAIAAYNLQRGWTETGFLSDDVIRQLRLDVHS